VLRRILAATLLVGAFLIDTPIATAEVTPTPALTAEDAGAWLDGLFPAVLARGDVAGAAVVVVKDGRILVEKGYGYADVEARRPVDPQRTLFRQGAISTLITWTAVMQLLEAGKLDLDRDVNLHLDFTIPPFERQPLTLRQLMTHTAGFEALDKYSFVESADQILPLDRFVKTMLPVRIYAPGATPAYSSYGAALAGYLVERASGQSFDDYVEEHIFAPLEMRHASFREPLPAALATDMSKTYERASLPPLPFELQAPEPDGSLSATAEDLAHFMITHLQDGRYGETRILQAQTARLMHATALAAIPPLDGTALGFHEHSLNQHRVIEQGGDTLYFHTDLWLFPDDGVGLYVALNSNGGGDIGSLTIPLFRNALLERFADRYFPGPPAPPLLDPAIAAEHAGLIAGRYETSRRAVTSFAAIRTLFTQTGVAANPDGTISVGSVGLDGMPKRYQEIAPFLWQEVGGHDRIAALAGTGAVQRFSREPYSGFMVWDRVPPGRSATWLEPAAGAAALIMVSTALNWPLAAFLRRRYRTGFELTGARACGYRLLSLGAVLMTLALVVFLALFGSTTSGPGFVAFASGRLDGVIHGFQLLLLFALVLGLGGALVNLATIWRAGTGWSARIWSIAAMLGAATLLWVALVFNMLNPVLQF
jgi:CubicO group peptidase (beta-lactamase class C family)